MIQLLQEDREDFVVKMSDLCTLEDAGIEDAHLARRPIDREHVISLLLSDARTWPPILVTKTDQGYVIIDGYHRVEAMAVKQLDEIRATCKTFKTEQDVIWACFDANLQHGLPLDERSKSNYARWLHIDV